jgi:hypothetical protein
MSASVQLAKPLCGMVGTVHGHAASARYAPLRCAPPRKLNEVSRRRSKRCHPSFLPKADGYSPHISLGDAHATH